MLRFSYIAKRSYASFRAGQPIHETRPHIVRAGDITTGISAMEYFNRRCRLADLLPEKSIAIIPGSSVKYASGSVFYNFQQNNDLFYLTGWNEPDSVCIIEKPTSDTDSVIFHLAVPPSDPAAELWEGERTGLQGAEEVFNADVTTSTSQFPTHLQKLLADYNTIFFDFPTSKDSENLFFNRMFPNGNRKQTDRANIETILRSQSSTPQIRPLSPLTTSLRVIKSNSELKIMRLAGKISGRAYNQAYAKTFRSEKGLNAFLEYKFIMGGCDKSAYIPVVAGGDHALCIHYTRNDDLLRDGDMVLVDAAGSLGGYCSDISRTWPVNGRFTPAQRELYEAVLNVQRGVMKECTVSSGKSLNDLHELSVQLMTTELRNAGFENLQSWEVSKYLYQHYIGHNLGLDVHDCPNYSRSKPLMRGQVVTVEPGVYVPNDERWPAEYRGVGIRIEDDIAVGDHSYVVLTAEAAKEMDDIESIAQNGVTTSLQEEVTDIFSL